MRSRFVCDLVLAFFEMDCPWWPSWGAALGLCINLQSNLPVSYNELNRNVLFSPCCKQKARNKGVSQGMFVSVDGGSEGCYTTLPSRACFPGYHDSCHRSLNSPKCSLPARVRHHIRRIGCS